MSDKSIFWFRRDLRLEDNAGLFHALQKSAEVQPIFIFDTEILDRLENKEDARVHFIQQQIAQIKAELETLGSTIHVFHGKPKEIFVKLFKTKEISAVYCNHDYEPYARERDEAIKKMCTENGISFYSFKDQVIFEKDEVLKDDGSPYSVFTPYSRKWKAKLQASDLESYLCSPFHHKFCKKEIEIFPSLEELGFKKSRQLFPSKKADLNIIKSYHKTRDIPSEIGTTRLSVHLRFGTISIRQLASIAKRNNESYLNELIWREFYMMILWHFPQVQNKAFKAKYDYIEWRNNEDEFKAWCEGKTGFPIIDAGMRELNETGFMHNRVRMIVASFLVKDLLIDWRWGEAYFAEKLLDFDLSANNGGWQWAAGSGCDAAPYFRIFNPESQQKKFDPQLKYIKKWLPEFDDPFVYPKPIVDRNLSRERALNAYKKALS
ncbi:MAG: deoxyribodipyrimidine photo-lyase [Bacteroidetes bacterium]|nr:deoxyribodipyrimidine photo-lyase [Bacteroidota bacterium]